MCRYFNTPQGCRRVRTPEFIQLCDSPSICIFIFFFSLIRFDRVQSAHIFMLQASLRHHNQRQHDRANGFSYPSRRLTIICFIRVIETETKRVQILKELSSEIRAGYASAGWFSYLSLCSTTHTSHIPHHRRSYPSSDAS